MKKIVLFALLFCGSIFASAENLKPFTVEGNEEKYNMIRVINETSQDTLSCRVVFLNEEPGLRDLWSVQPECQERPGL